MKKKEVYASICISALIMTISKSSFADSVPPNISSAIDRSEAFSAGNTYFWRVQGTEQDMGDAPNVVREAKENVTRDTKERVRREGISNQDYTNSQIQKNVDQLTLVIGGNTSNISGDVSFANYGGKTLVQTDVVTHSLSPFSNVKETDVHYYDGPLALIATTAGAGQFSKSGPWLPVHPLPGYVWNAPGESKFYQSAAPESGMTLLPEELAVLGGQNILKIYGAQWSVESTTPTTMVLYSKIQHTDERITLDRLHENLPSEIINGSLESRKGRIWYERYRVLSFKMINNHYIPSMVVFDANYGNFRKARTWSFVAWQPSKPINLKIPTAVAMTDFRLAKSVGVTDVLHIMGQHDNRMIAYRWQGRFLSVAELEQLQSAANPDIQFQKHTTGLILTLGALLVVVGIISYRLRRQETIQD